MASASREAPSLIVNVRFSLDEAVKVASDMLLDTRLLRWCRANGTGEGTDPHGRLRVMPKWVLLPPKVWPRPKRQCGKDVDEEPQGQPTSQQRIDLHVSHIRVGRIAAGAAIVPRATRLANDKRLVSHSEEDWRRIPPAVGRRARRVAG